MSLKLDAKYCESLAQSNADAAFLCSELLATKTDTDIFYILWAASLVFFMHCGFAMLSAGAVRTKNTKNILLCILLDACACAVAWWLLGFGFAYGDSANLFIGTNKFVGMGFENGVAYQEWFFQFAFAATAATIVSGSVAERATFEAYITYSFFLSLWVYPVVVHWVWGGGWLTLGKKTSLLGVGALDFAGDGPVHMVGGVAGAIGSKIIGPRVGRFDSDGNPVDIPGHSSPLAFLGVFILWVGWFGFNSGSALSIVGNGLTAERAAVNTMLSSATGGLGALFFSTLIKPGREWDINAALNGVLAGLVAITGCCPVVETWAALLIGLFGGIFYIGASAFTLRVLKIDDPLDATPVHAGLGMYGLIMGGLFAKTEFMQVYLGFEDDRKKDFAGVFYGGNGKLLACQVVEIIVVMCWVAAFIGPYFYFLKVMGWFRISSEQEEIGLDASSHGGAAYPELYEEGNIAKAKKAHVQQENADDSVKSGNAGPSDVEIVTN